MNELELLTLIARKARNAVNGFRTGVAAASEIESLHAALLPWESLDGDRQAIANAGDPAADAAADAAAAGKPAMTRPAGQTE